MNKQKKLDRKRTKRRDRQAARRVIGPYTPLPAPEHVTAALFAKCPTCGYAKRAEVSCARLEDPDEDLRAQHDRLVAHGARHFHMFCAGCRSHAVITVDQ